jgi:hypothetical protein
MSTILYRSDSPYVPRPIERRPNMAAVQFPTSAMRMLILSQRADPAIATEGVFVSELASALLDRGHHVNVAAAPPYPELGERAGLVELPQAERPGSPLRLVGRVSGRFSETMESLLFGRRLAQHLRGEPLSHDLVFDNQTLCWSLIKLMSKGMRVIGFVHDEAVARRRLKREVLRRMERILVFSPQVFEALLREPEIDSRRLTLVPRGQATRGERAAQMLETIMSEPLRA